MYYEINVAERYESSGETRYRHLFATHERSLPTALDVRRVLPKLQAAFPAPDYTITITRWEERGERTDPKEFA